MLERFTTEGRQLVVVAHEESRSLGHSYIGAEHLLLGLLRARGELAARVLESFGITLERVRSDVVRIVGRGDGGVADQVPFTPRATRVLELALREALSLGHELIGGEHILLALVREGESVATRLLLDGGVDPDEIVAVVIDSLGSSGRERAERFVPPPDRESRLAIDRAWIEGFVVLLDRLPGEIRRELGREPDPGDLLLAIACAKETIPARALREIGVDLDSLAAAIEGVRREHHHTVDAHTPELERLRSAKEQAIESRDFQTAARLRDEERALVEKIGPAPDELHEAIRARLGIPTPPT